MANALYGLGREKFLTGNISWSTDDIKCCLVDSADYTASIDTHEYLSDVTSAGIIATSGNLASKTVTLGVADAADVTFTSVSSTNDQAEVLVIYKDTGSSSTSPLIAYFDTVTGLPITPNDSDITVQWSTGANRIFKL